MGSKNRRRGNSAGGAAVATEEPVVDAVIDETPASPDPEPAAEEVVVVEALPVVVADEAPAAMDVALQPTGWNWRGVAIMVVVAFIVLDLAALVAYLAGVRVPFLP